MTILDSPPSTPTQPELLPTYGPLACAWIESFLVHGQGSHYGQPFKIRSDFRRFLYDWYTYEPYEDGSFRRWRYSAAYREKAKGGAKTEENAAIALLEFCGPPEIAAIAPDIPVAAASFEQADLLFGRAKQMVEHDSCALKPYIDAYDTELRIKGKQGRLYRIAGQAGTNDGGLPTLVVGDELHEWTGRRERLELILANNATKRDDSHGVLYGTTPGHDKNTVAGRLHDKGVKGEDERFLHQWITADPTLNLQDPKQLRLAVTQANPWASPDHIERLTKRFEEVPEHEFRRYHLCQWVEVPESGWLSDKPGAWERCIGTAKFGTGRIAMAIDMSVNRDTTAVAVAQNRSDGKVPVQVKIFDPEDSGGRVDFLEVKDHIRRMALEHRPEAITYDPRYLEVIARELADEALPMLEMPQSPERMGPATALTYDLILSGSLEHDGDGLLASHVKGANKRSTDRGFTLSKGRSSVAIDGCIAMVMAVYEATQGEPDEPGTLVTF